MDETEWGLRLRAFLDRYFGLVVALAVVVALAGGYWTLTAYGNEQTRVETEQVSSWDSTATFAHSATVLNGTDVYEQGVTLENRSSYFRQITPLLNGSFRYGYSADSGDLQANASTVLVLRSVGESEEGNATEYWRLESTLENREIASLSPGERLRVPFSLNVSAAAQRLDEIDSQFGSTPGQKEVLVETRLHLSGTRNGQSVETNETYQVPISASSNVYQVQDPGTVTDGGSQSVRRTVTVESGAMAAYGGPAVLLVGLALLVALGGGRYAGFLAVSDAEREWLAYRNHRSEFDDWITVARIPDGDEPERTVTVETLEGLVDVAIDTDQRVLEDSERDRFLVFGPDRTYAYSPPAVLADDPLDGSDGTGALRDGTAPQEEPSVEENGGRTDDATAPEQDPSE